MKTFEPDKNAQQQGIDTSRTFVVVDAEKNNSNYPLFKRLSDRKEHYCYWSSLAYADEKKSWDNFEIGDSFFNEEGDEAKILWKSEDGKLFIKSYWKFINNDWDIMVGGTDHIEEAKRRGWYFKNEETADKQKSIEEKIEEFDKWFRALPDLIEEDDVTAKLKELFLD